MNLVGVIKPIIADEVVLAIHQNSGGLLRRVNIIARKSMMAAAMGKSQMVSGEHTRLAGTEIT